MPRIDLWAVEAQFQMDENTDSCPTSHKLLEREESCFKESQLVGKDSECNTEEKKSPEMAQGQASRTASYAWMSFLEQVQSIGGVSTSLMILVCMFILPLIYKFPCAIGLRKFALYILINCFVGLCLCGLGLNYFCLTVTYIHTHTRTHTHTMT